MTNIRLDQLPDDLDEWIDESSEKGNSSYFIHQPKPASKFENGEDWENFFENNFIDHDKKRNYSRAVEDKLYMRSLKRELYNETES